MSNVTPQAYFPGGGSWGHHPYGQMQPSQQIQPQQQLLPPPMPLFHPAHLVELDRQVQTLNTVVLGDNSIEARLAQLQKELAQLKAAKPQESEATKAVLLSRVSQLEQSHAALRDKVEAQATHMELLSQRLVNSEAQVEEMRNLMFKMQHDFKMAQTEAQNNSLYSTRFNDWLSQEVKNKEKANGKPNEIPNFSVGENQPNSL